MNPRFDLAAVLVLDACDFCRIVRYNEAGALTGVRADLNHFRKIVHVSQGEVTSFTGDGLIAIFTSTRSAVDAALRMQRYADNRVSTPKISYRIGINLGDTFRIDSQVIGDTVNVAARIQSFARPGGILVSKAVREALRGRSDLDLTSSGAPYLKNIGEHVEMFEVRPIEPGSGRKPFALRLFGTFKLIGRDGREVPLPEELRAILTIIALSDPEGCTRMQLSDILWSECSPHERLVRLDAALIRLDDILGNRLDEIVRTEDSRLSLIQDGIDCDLFAERRAGEQRQELLGNFSYGGLTFQNWLSQQRSLLRSAICLDLPTMISSHVDDPTRVAPMLFSIGFLPARANGGGNNAIFAADLVADWLMRSLTEIEAIEIHDYRPGADGTKPNPTSDRSTNGPDLFLECRARTASGMLQISVSAHRPEDRKVIWSQSTVTDEAAFLSLSSRSAASFVSSATDALLSALVTGRHIHDPAAHQAAKTAIGAVHHLLTLTGPGLDRLEADIAAAYEIDPKPVYMAWLAYMTTFQLGERQGVRDAAFYDRARELARRAIEADSQNGTVLGLVAHVHSYVFREFSYADYLIEHALERSPFRSICWDSASLLYSYTGRNREAIEAAETARRIGRHNPYRHLFDGACCVASLVNGRFEEAARFGEQVIAVQPEFKALLRYTAASYGMMGDVKNGQRVMTKLLDLEPDLCLELLRDNAYPAPSKLSADLLASGLGRVGLPQH